MRRHRFVDLWGGPPRRAHWKNTRHRRAPPSLSSNSWDEGPQTRFKSLGSRNIKKGAKVRSVGNWRCRSACGSDSSRVYILPLTEDGVESNATLRPCHSHKNMQKSRESWDIVVQKSADVTLRMECGVTTILKVLTCMKTFSNCRKRKHDLQAAKRTPLNYSQASI
jgi:hypothetical protein